MVVILTHTYSQSWRQLHSSFPPACHQHPAQALPGASRRPAASACCGSAVAAGRRRCHICSSRRDVCSGRRDICSGGRHVCARARARARRGACSRGGSARPRGVRLSPSDRHRRRLATTRSAARGACALRLLALRVVLLLRRRVGRGPAHDHHAWGHGLHGLLVDRRGLLVHCGRLLVNRGGLLINRLLVHRGGLLVYCSWLLVDCGGLLVDCSAGGAG